MDFPPTGLMDGVACCERLVRALHPEGLTCPRCGGDHYGVHRRHRDPVVDYRRGRCRRAFNAFTGTAPQGTGRPPSVLVLILRGVARGTPTARLAREPGRDRMKLLELRHELQDHATAGLDPAALPDVVVEADECYVNAGEKEASRIPIRMTHHVGGPTSGATAGPSITTGLRSPRRSAAARAGPACTSSPTRTGGRWRGRCRPRRPTARAEHR